VVAGNSGWLLLLDLIGNTGNFKYHNHIAKSGTINEIEVDTNGSIAYQLTGFHISVADFLAFAKKDNAGGFLKTVFAHNDTLTGSSGDDTLNGYGGKDAFTGGGGKDIFVFRKASDSAKGVKHDTILDFSGSGDLSGQHDQIDLSAIDAKPGHGNQAFKFIGAENFHHHKGELHVLDKGSGVFFVEGDIDGNGKADFQIEVHSAFAPVVGDFIL
jgi:Ca2+-binding RTX toxin-like protein